MSKKLTTTDFIGRAKKVHGNKYDYSKIEYVNNRTNVKIVCALKKCLFEFIFSIFQKVKRGCI